jgi:hypothetical protein
VLIPGTAEFDSLEPGKKAEEMMQALRQWKAECQVAATIMQASELLDYELKQGELLDARIARKIKFCFELKTMEQMRSQARMCGVRRQSCRLL